MNEQLILYVCTHHNITLFVDMYMNVNSNERKLSQPEDEKVCNNIPDVGKFIELFIIPMKKKKKKKQ
jgi:hypothetical protein